MGRQIVAVLTGVLVSFLAAAASGYVIYQLSSGSPEAAPALARYLFNPIIALLVGACVGALVRSHPGILAALSLAPSSIAPLLSRQLDSAHLFFMIFLSGVNLLLAAAAAVFVFRLRSQKTAHVSPVSR